VIARKAIEYVRLFINPLLIKERGIKRVPRKIEDFSGCLKRVRLVRNLATPSLELPYHLW